MSKETGGPAFPYKGYDETVKEMDRMYYVNVQWALMLRIKHREGEK